MTPALFFRVLGFSALASLSACDGLSLDTHWRSEQYVLLAIDSPGQMHLALSRGNGTSLGLVGPTVFSIGADDNYIVAKQHPATDGFGAFDRTVTNYFVVERTTSPSFDERKKGVRGPMSREEFDRIAKTLPLPQFSKTIKDLE